MQRYAAGVGLTGAVTEWPHNAAHQVNGELLIPRRDRGVNGEDGVTLDVIKRAIKRLARGDELACALHEV